MQISPWKWKHHPTGLAGLFGRFFAGHWRPICTNGHVTRRYDYDAFGNGITFTVSAHPANIADTTIRYTGEQWDAGSGTYDLRSRDYRPDLGRFSASDDITITPGDLGNADLYLYVSNNAVNSLDPSGRFSLGESVTVGAIAGGLIGFGYGAYKGAVKSGHVLSWQTLEYGVVGAVVGAGIGALAGAGVYGAASGLGYLAQIAGTGSWVYDLILAAHGTRIPAFGLGVISGVVLGLTDAPGAEGVLAAGGESALNAFLFAYGRISRINAHNAIRISPTAQQYFQKVLFRNWANRPVTGYGIARAATFWASWFFAGFTVGYATTKAIKWGTDEVIQYLEDAQLAYDGPMQDDIAAIDATPA